LRLGAVSETVSYCNKLAIDGTIQRKAWQLKITPQRLIARILEMGILEIDSNLSHNCDPLEVCLLDDFNCTAAMDAMSFDEITKIEEASGENCQRVLFGIDSAKRGLR